MNSLSRNTNTLPTGEIHARQIAFFAAFILPMYKIIEAPSLLARYANGDLLLPALLHYLLQTALLLVLLYAAAGSEKTLFERMEEKLGKLSRAAIRPTGGGLRLLEDIVQSLYHLIGMVEGKLSQSSPLNSNPEFKEGAYLLLGHPAAVIADEGVYGLKTACDPMIKDESAAAGLDLDKALFLQRHKPGVDNRLAYFCFLLKLALGRELIPGAKSA